eukprot:gene1360-11442_t
MDEEEIEVLESIYGEELKKTEKEKFVIKIKVAESLEPILFHFWYTNKIPEFMIESNWLSGEDISKISTKLENNSKDKTQVIYDMIEWIRENLNEEIDFSTILNNQTENKNEVTKEIKKINQKEILHGESFSLKKSKFIAHIAKLESLNDVKMVLNQLKQDKKIMNATHNIYAYRVLDVDGKFHEANEDDGEFGASQQILFLLQKHNLSNYLVVVTRWYGGIHLGADRFKIISNLAKVMIEKVINNQNFD